jgi:hypothetical protein
LEDIGKGESVRFGERLLNTLQHMTFPVSRLKN